MLDLKADRSHPRKRNRPFASVDVSLQRGVFLAAVLFGAGALISLTMAPAGLFLVLMIYFALTLAYSLKLKRSMIIYIWVLASLYTIRIVAGGLATGVALSPWLLTFAMFLFLGLAAIKRQAELADTRTRAEETLVGRAYLVSDLPVIRSIAIAAGYASVLVFALYINSLASAEIYSQPEFLWGVCPVLLFWFSHMVMITHRGEMDDDPLLYALKDRTSLFCGGAVAAFFALATFFT